MKEELKKILEKLKRSQEYKISGNDFLRHKSNLLLSEATKELDQLIESLNGGKQ